MRLNVKLSPDLERQLIDTSMVPLSEADDHILTIETTSAMPAPLPEPTRLLPSILGPTSSARRASASASASQSGKLVIPAWATLNRSHPSAAIETSLQQCKPGIAGPYGYQPDFMHSPHRHISSDSPVKRRSSTALLPPTSPDGQAASLGSPTSRQGSTPSLVQQGSLIKASGLVKQGSLLSPGLPPIPIGAIPKQASLPSGRARRPSLLALSGLHSLPEHDPYLGAPKPKNSPRRTSSFMTGNLNTPPPGKSGSRKTSFEESTAHSAVMPMFSLEAQKDVLDASLMEPELVDQSAPPEIVRADTAHLLVELSRSSTSGSLEAHASAAAALPPVLASLHLLCCYCSACRCMWVSV